MKKDWYTFVIYTSKEIIIDSLKAWCDFWVDKENWQTIKDYRLRDVTYIKNKKVPVFEDDPYTEERITLPGFFKRYLVDFRPLKNTVPEYISKPFEIYYYQLMQAAGQDRVCQKCGKVNSGRKVCTHCRCELFVDIKDVLSELVEEKKPKKTVCKTVKPDPDELNSAYHGYKYRRYL